MPVNITDRVDVPESLQHAAWRGETKDVININQTQVDMNKVSQWVVKLEFTAGNGKLGDKSSGSGSFVNIPDYNKLVVFTAAHNLIAPNGQKSTELTVFYGNKMISVDQSDTFVSSKYDPAKAATTAQPEDDYGIVIVDDSKAKINPKVAASSAPELGKAFGFGFSVKLAQEKELPGVVTVSGYKTDSIPGKPIDSQGDCNCYANRLDYKALTEKGISGSPVWVSHEGYPTVIGIHNNSPERKGGRSRGARITMRVIKEIFEWIKIGETGRYIRATNNSTDLSPDGGLYLTMSAKKEFGVVTKGPKSGSQFDIMPVQSGGTASFYVLMYKSQFVVFNVAKKKLLLQDTITDMCQFAINPPAPRQPADWINQKPVRFTIEDKNGVPGVSGLPKYQLQIGKAPAYVSSTATEWTGISLVSYPTDNNKEWTKVVVEKP